MRRNLLVVAVAALFVVSCFGDDSKSVISVTTKSRNAARLYQEGVELQGNLRTTEAIAKWRSAVKADPEFAMAWAMIAASENSPAEALKARNKARSLMPKAAKGEQMMIRWIVNRGDSDIIAAIAAANDLVAAYPGDKVVLSTVGSWMTGLYQWDRAIALQEKALAVDPNYAPALNEAGYVYAHQRNFDKAIDAMKRYVAVIPKEPNPQDSYAEILRLAGKYDEALAHYREALKLMPAFTSSQLGLGDTYALMGDQERARAEYARCFTGVEMRYSNLCRQMAAYSYIRENKFDEARNQMESVITTMQKQGQSWLAADSMITLSFIDKDVPSSFADLDRAAKQVIGDATVPKADRDEMLARIASHKVRIAASAGDTVRAEKALAELQSFARKSTDPLIQASWKGGHGAWLLSQKNYADAITELQDDPSNPFSQMLLVKAYQASGNDKAASDLKDSVLTLRRLEIDLWMAQQALKS